MPRGGARPGAGRPRKTQAEKPAKEKPAAKAGFSEDGKKSESAPKGWPFGTEDQEPEAAPDLSDLTPLDFILAVMRNPEESKSLRLQAATLAAPYCHAKKGEGGKKDEKADRAKKAAGGRFASATPPKLVASGGKKL